MPQQVIHLTPDLWVFQSEIYRTNSGVWLRDGAACLVDPGVLPDEIERIAAFLEAQEAVPRWLAITHGHWDHMLGVRRFPGVNVAVHAAYPSVVARRGPGIQRFLAHWYAQAGIPRGGPFELPQADILFEGTLTLRFGGETLQVIHAPGHAPDHAVLYQPEAGILWAGDMLSDNEIPCVMDSLLAYEHTLAALAGRRIHALAPGHGDPTTDAAEIQARLTRDQDYLAGLRAGVAEGIRRRLSIEEIVARCADLARPYPDSQDIHILNLESAWLEIGGFSPVRPLGWERAWKQMFAGN